MKKFFTHLGQRRVYEKTFQNALDYAKKGEKATSFEIFSELLSEHPYDVNVRRQVLLLANELGKDVKLSNENVRSLKQ